MYNFAFFLKTYRGDYDRAMRLLESFSIHNIERLPLYLACPKEDISLFAEKKYENVSVIAEETISIDVFIEDEKWSKGYLNQEIFKLAFWELGLAKNYMCIDSDALFIRDFIKRDFMYDDEYPYTILIEDNELHSDKLYNAIYWDGRLDWLKKIEDEVDFHPYRLLTCHGFQIFSAEALENFKKFFLDEKSLTYKDIIRIAPFEFTWYNLWVQKTNCIPIHFCEPLFKTFHLKQHHINALMNDMRIADWARGYIGIVVNSNYGVGNGEYDDYSIYNAYNCEIPSRIIKLNFRFYRKLKRGLLLRRLRGVVRLVRERKDKRNNSDI